MTLPAARRLRSALAACALALACGSALPRPAPAQEGAAAVQDVTLTDVALPLGATLVKAPKLTASGTRLSRDDLAAIFKADSSEPWPARLARLDAGSLTAPVLVTEHAAPDGARQTITYRDIVARDVRGGRIGELTAAGATLSATGPKGGPTGAGAGTYGQMHATGVDLAALARLASEPGDGKGPVLKVYGTLQIADAAFSDERGTTVKLAQLEGRDLGGRQVPGGWNGALDALTAGLRDPTAKGGAATSAADLIEAEALGSLEIRGMSVSDSDAAGPLLLGIDRLSYAEAGPDAGVQLEGLTLARGEVRARLGRLALAGASLAPTVAGLRRLAARPEAELTPEEARRLAPTFGTLTLSDLSIDLPPGPAPARAIVREAPREAKGLARPRAGEPARPQEPRTQESRAGEPSAGDPLAVAGPRASRIALREAVLGAGPAPDGIPTSSRLTLSGLSLPAGLVAGLPLVGALPAYGYDNLDLDLAAEGDWDEAARDVRVREIAVSGKGIGSVRLSGLFGGIGPELFSGSVPAETMLMFSGNAKTLDLTVENAGLFERFLAAQAKDLSLKPDELRKEYVTASVLGVPVILGNGPAAKGIGAAMGQFVMNPGRLTIRAKSKEPTGLGFVELGMARSPAAVLDRIDVDAKAN